MRHAEQGRQLQYVVLKMTESMLHTRMQYAYTWICHASSRGQQDTTPKVPDWMAGWRIRVRGTAGVQLQQSPAGWRIRVRGDDALGSRKRGHEMVCDMPVMQQGRQMQLAEVHVGCNS